MRRKRIRIIAIFFAAFMLMLYTPSIVTATGDVDDMSDEGEDPPVEEEDEREPGSPIEHDLDKIVGEEGAEGQLTIIDSSCPQKCPGHRIINSGTGATHKTIRITTDPSVKKKHTIYIDGTVNIEAQGDAPAFQICNGAQVELVLNAGCKTTFKSKTGAGLQVDKDCKLEIRGKGELEAIGGSSCAGIGGDSRKGCGDITIIDGNITARGGTTGAGIGTGRAGRCGNISIKGGTIVAVGGNGKAYDDVGAEGAYIAGGPGIGHGDPSYGGNGGNVIISGGEIRAIGGQNDGKDQTSGFNCDRLTSPNDGSADITTNSLDGAGYIPPEFSAIIWIAENETERPKAGTVYGDAILDKDLVGVKLEMQPGSSLTIPKKSSVKVDEDSTIEGDSSNHLIMAGDLEDNGYISPTIQRKVSLARGDIRVNNNQTYTGEDLKGKIFELINPRPDPDDPDNKKKAIPVDTTNWNWENPRVELGGKDQKGVICDANPIGEYTISFEHRTKGVVDDKIIIENIKVLQADFDKCTIEPIGKQIYDGKEKKPEITFGKIPVVKEKDYEVRYEGADGGKAIEPGNAVAIITTSQNGNFKPTEKRVPFIIEQAPLDKATVKMEPEEWTYDGKSHGPDDANGPKFTVELDGKELDEKSYKIIPSTNDFISAGTITYTIEGDGNYTGKLADKEFVIKPKPVKVDITKPIKAENRAYDSTTNAVKITDIALEDNGIIDEDKGRVEVEAKGIVSSKNAGKYDMITGFESIELTGERADNYSIDLSNIPAEGLTLTPSVEIYKIDPQPTKITALYDVNEDKTQFVCTIEFEHEADVKYLYKKDDENAVGEPANVFGGILPGEEHTFYVYSEETENVIGKPIGKVTVVFEPVDRKEEDVPDDFDMECRLNEDEKTYTVTIPPQENVEYSFTGKDDDFSSEEGANIKADCKPNTEYKGYVRYKATDTLKASIPKESKLTTPKLDVKKPVIELEDGASFNFSRSVKIICETEGAAIYYTIDGTDPVPGENGEKYDEEKGVQIKDSVTIKAIAVKDGMNDSEIASSSLIREWLQVETPEISPEIFHTKTQEITIACGTADAKIYYTTDGTDPDPASDPRNCELYDPDNPFEVKEMETTVKAIAVKADMIDSKIETVIVKRVLLDVETPKIYPEEDTEFIGSKLVRIECGTEGATIYYTTDGSDPTIESKKYKGKPFRVGGSDGGEGIVTIKAIAVKEDMNDSAIASVTFNKADNSIEMTARLGPFVPDEEEGDNEEKEKTKHKLISMELRRKLKEQYPEEPLNTKEEEVEFVHSLLTRELDVLGVSGDFVVENMEPHNLMVWIKIDTEPEHKPGIDDFPVGGYAITIPYPDKILDRTAANPESKWKDYNYAIAHMISEGEKVGDIEVFKGKEVKKTPKGLQFTITSASPIILGWTKEGGEFENKVGEGFPVEDGSDIDDPPSGEPEGSQTLVTTNPVSGSQGEGAAASGGSTGAGSVSDAVKSALSTILPKTGDTNKIIAWIVVAVVSVGVIIGVRMKSRKDKAKGKGKDKKDGKKTKK